MPIKGSTKGWFCIPEHGPHYAHGLCEGCYNRRRLYYKNGNQGVPEPEQKRQTTYEKYIELRDTYGFSVEQCAKELDIKKESVERAIMRHRAKGGDAHVY